MIDPALENELRPSLSPGEQLIWAGKPKTGIRFKGSDAILIPFSIVWLGFALFWEFGVASINAPFFFKIFGIPFILVGIYFVVGRFFVDSMRRQNTTYGITSTRVIIKSGLFNSQMKSLQLQTLSDITVTQHVDNSGTIQLGPSGYGHTGMHGSNHVVNYPAPALEFIENPNHVYSIIIALQRRANP